MIWTLECIYLLNVVLSFYSRHIPRNRMDLSYMAFIVLGCIPSILTLLRVSIISGCYISSNAFYVSLWYSKLHFFLNVNSILHFWNKPHLAIVWLTLTEMFVCPQIRMLKSSPQCDGVGMWNHGRWWSHEAELL